MDRARTRGLVFAAICGVMMVVLSFASWVHFKSVDYGAENYEPISITLSGTETSVQRDLEVINTDTVQEEDGWCSCRVGFGDGYVTAALGVALVLMAAWALATSRHDKIFGMGIVAVSVGVLFVAGYNAVPEWKALAWTERGQTEFVTGSAQPALWALVATSVMSALLGAALWTLRRFEEEDEWDEVDEENSDDAMNSLVLNHEGAGQAET